MPFTTASLKVMVRLPVGEPMPPSAGPVLVTVGAVVSILMIDAAVAVLTLPAVSVALAVKLCAPSDNADGVYDQLPLPSAVVVPNKLPPS